jgi:integrase/recombinase XerC
MKSRMKTIDGASPSKNLDKTLHACWLRYKLDLNARNVRPKTLSGAEYACCRLMGFFGEGTAVDNISTTNLKEFFVLLHSYLAPQSVETIFRKTKTWFEFLVREGIMNDNPFGKLKNIKLDRTVLPHLVENEVEQILAQISRPKTLFELRDYLLFCVALDTGLRLTEIAELSRQSLDLPQVIIRRGKMGKGRIVCIGATTHKVFLTYLNNLVKVTENMNTLWISASGEKLTNRGIQLVFRRMSKRTGIEIHPHKIRRTTALQYLKSKVDLHTIRQLMGWNSFEMVQRYVAIDATLIEEAVLNASPVDRMSKKNNRKVLNSRL